MRRVLHRLLRSVRPDDGEAILDDLEQEYRARLRSTRGRLGAEVWYAWEVLAATAHGGRDQAADWATALRRMDGGHAHSVSRLFRTHSGYVIMSTVVLAASIGVNLLVFTIVNALWLRPMPYPEADRVVTIPQETFASVEHLRAMFEGGVAGQVLTNDQYDGLRVRIDVAGQPLETLGVTSGYFNVLRLAIHGRDFTGDDDRDGVDPVAIISDRLWSRAFGRRDDAIGSIVTATPIPIRVIGVAPPAFEGARRGERTDIWMPASLVRRLAPADWSGASLPMTLLARLGPGQTAAMVERRYRDLAVPPDRLAILVANNLSWALPTVMPLTEVFGTPDTRTIIVDEGNLLLVVSGLALLVLFGGCVTIAALVLTHYERRRSELALKMSLGAGRHRLVLELLRDLASIAVTGCAGGVLVTVLGVRVLPALKLPQGANILQGGVDIGRLDLSIDWRVASVAMAATVLTLFVAAALPIARSTRARLAGEMLTGPSTTLGSLRTRQTLLGLQACAAVVVLVAAGVFVRAVTHGFGSAAGFDVERTVFVSIQEGAPRATGGNPYPLILERGTRLLSVLREMPGVNEVAEGIAPIGTSALNTNPTKPRALQLHGRQHQLPVGLLRGSPNLLAALGVPILAGRTLTAADSAGEPQPAVITQSLAERLWPDGGALGQTLSVPESRMGGPFLIVGIARDVAFGSLTRPVSEVIVTAGAGDSAITSSFVVRTDRPQAVAALVGRMVEGQVVQARTGREVIAQDIGRQRLGAWFFSGFGLAALLLGVGGAFGLVAYLAESQRREFGVRLALGANRRHLVRHGIVAALVPVSAGVAAGLALGALVSQAFRALLVGVGTVDVVTYLAVALIMLGGATTAALVAAWRLRRMSPSDALRTT